MRRKALRFSALRPACLHLLISLIMDSIDTVLKKLRELGAHELSHINGDLEKHLKGTRNLLAEWGNSEPVCMAGLYHAVYGTEDFPEELVPLDKRQEIAKIIGEDAEALVYFYGACDRRHT